MVIPTCVSACGCVCLLVSVFVSACMYVWVYDGVCVTFLSGNLRVYVHSVMYTHIHGSSIYTIRHYKKKKKNTDIVP